jgi:phosphohistidine phosphatase
MALPELYLVRHGEAEGASSKGDAARVLTSGGRARLAGVAAALARFAPGADIWHSPYVRAKQTAQILSDVVKPASFDEREAFTPDADPTAAARELVKSGRHILIVVSHLPLLPAVLDELLAGGRYEMPVGSVAHLGVLTSGRETRGSCALLGLWTSDRIPRGDEA